MVKTYLRYKPSSTFGLITSSSCNIAVDSSGKNVFTGQLEQVGVWNLRRGALIKNLTLPNSDSVVYPETTRLELAPNGKYLAAGYADGMIRVFDVDTMALIMSLNGHSRAVTAFAFNHDCTQLASGSRDTDLIIWDLISESGLCRFRGHKDQITDIQFMSRPLVHSETGLVDSYSADQPLVATSSKDTLLKVWDIPAKRCIQTIIGSRTELWSICVAPDRSNNEGMGMRLIAVGADNLIRMWSVGPRSSIRKESPSKGGDEDEELSKKNEMVSSDSILFDMGTIPRQTSDRATQVRVSPCGGYIVICSHGRTMEVYARRDFSSVRRRVIRRLRRSREKFSKKKRETEQMAHESSTLKASKDESDNEELDAYGMDGLNTLDDIEAQLRGLEAAIRLDEEAQRGPNAVLPGSASVSIPTVAGDEWDVYVLLGSSVKLMSFSLFSADFKDLSIVASTENNQLELFSAPLGRKPTDFIEPATSKKSLTESKQFPFSVSTTTTSAGVLLPVLGPVRAVHAPGHRSDIRNLAVSSDGSLILSCSSNEVKIWNASTSSLLRTLDLGSDAMYDSDGEEGEETDSDSDESMDSQKNSKNTKKSRLEKRKGRQNDTALCGVFLPSDRTVVVGTKAGRLLVFDLGSSDLIQVHSSAHTGPIFAIASRPDGKGIASGGSDKTVKFWDLSLIKSKAGAAYLSLTHTRTLKVNDEVLSICYSRHTDSTKLLIAASLLDSTVSVFFDDSLKFALSLYGHKLPVLSMDVSADSTLLVTGSADKTVKLWGLDFGDCHHSFLAHGDSVTCVRFIARTHYFFSLSKDAKIKYWDGDRFVLISQLQGHKAEAWCGALSPDGSFLVSAGHDRSIRLWKRSEEQVFLDEERERELMENEYMAGEDGNDVAGGSSDLVGAVGEDGLAITTVKEDGELVNPMKSKSTLEDGSATTIIAHNSRDSAKSSVRLSDALALAETEFAAWREYMEDRDSAVALTGNASEVALPPRNPELIGLTPAQYVLRTLRSIQASDIDQILIVMPFLEVVQLLRIFLILLKDNQAVELCAHCVTVLVKLHRQRLAVPALLPMVLAIRGALANAVNSARSQIGYNRAALTFLQSSLETLSFENGNGEKKNVENSAFLGSMAVRAKPKRLKAEKRDFEGINLGKRRKVKML